MARWVKGGCPFTKRKSAAMDWVAEEARGFGSKHTRRTAMCTDAIDDMPNVTWYQRWGSWSYCDLCGRRRFGALAAPPLEGGGNASAAVDRCRKCPLPVDTLQEEPFKRSDTGTLYVSPQEHHWPRYIESQEAYVHADIAGPEAPSLIDLPKEECWSLAPLRLFCTWAPQRGQSGHAAVANVKKLSVIRAEWNSVSVPDSMTTARARAAFAYLMEANSTYRHYVEEHGKQIQEGFPHGRKISTYGLLMKMPGVEVAARPHLYPHTCFGDTDLRERLYALGHAGPGQQLSTKSSFMRKALSRCRRYYEDFHLAFLIYDVAKAHQAGLFFITRLLRNVGKSTCAPTHARAYTHVYTRTCTQARSSGLTHIHAHTHTHNTLRHKQTNTNTHVLTHAHTLIRGGQHLQRGRPPGHLC